MVVNTEDSIVLDFVACKSCHHVYDYKKKNGTTVLSQHKCKISNDQSTLTFFGLKSVRPGPETPAAFSTSVKKQATWSCKDFVVTDLQPHPSIGGQGFITLIQQVGHYNAYQNIPGMLSVLPNSLNQPGYVITASFISFYSQ